MGVPTTTLPLQGALHTLVLTAGAVPETQRSPQTTPPRELLTPESQENRVDLVRHHHCQEALQQTQVFPPQRRAPPRQKEGGWNYLHTFTEPTPSHNLWERKGRP